MLRRSREDFQAAYSGENAAEWVSWGLETSLEDWWYEIGQANNWYVDAAGSWAGGSDRQAIYDLIQCVSYLINAHSRLKTQGGPLLTDYMQLDAWYFSVFEGAPGWKAIVRAMGEATDAGRMWWITELDWMRKLMWNTSPEIKWHENPYE